MRARLEGREGRLVVDLVIEPEWPRNGTDARVATASLFAAHVLACDLIAAEREGE